MIMGVVSVLVSVIIPIITLFIGYYLGVRWKMPILVNPISAIKNKKYGDKCM